MQKHVLISCFLLLSTTFAYAIEQESSRYVCQKKKCSAEFVDALHKAEAGDANAQNRVGEMLHFGEGVQQDYLAAKDWYLKAAEGGHAVAPNHLGRLFLNGEGVVKDSAEACRWYKISAERGDIAGEHNFATCKHDGTKAKPGKHAGPAKWSEIGNYSARSNEWLTI